jgi:cob(I)alamin adenosyltransferase
MTKIYTKTGDKGETGTFGGKRVSKANLQIEAGGVIDESTSSLGLCYSIIKQEDKKHSILIAQKNLYQIMAYIAGAKVDVLYLKSEIQKLEQDIDSMWLKLPPLHAFIIPGDNEINARVHMSRALVRSAERAIVRYYLEDSSETKEVKIILQYINRLSDYLFALARTFAEKEVKAK